MQKITNTEILKLVSKYINVELRDVWEQILNKAVFSEKTNGDERQRKFSLSYNMPKLAQENREEIEQIARAAWSDFGEACLGVRYDELYTVLMAQYKVCAMIRMIREKSDSHLFDRFYIVIKKTLYEDSLKELGDILIGEKMLSVAEVLILKALYNNRLLLSEFGGNGLISAINRSNISSMVNLGMSSLICFNPATAQYQHKSNLMLKASAKEINIISEMKYIFSDISSEDSNNITEEDIMEAQSALRDNWTRATADNENVKKIYEWASNLPSKDIEEQNYYHARLKSTPPEYQEAEMRNAPDGYTHTGRFNSAGQAYFYFADSRKGAEIEVAKHSNDLELYCNTGVYSIHGLKMVDLTENIEGAEALLKVIHKAASANNGTTIEAPIEYVIPNLIKDAINNGCNDGIMYGSEFDYTNYVAFNYYEDKIKFRYIEKPVYLVREIKHMYGI